MDTGLDAALSDSLDDMEYLFSPCNLFLCRQTIHVKLRPHMMEYYKHLVCFLVMCDIRYILKYHDIKFYIVI